MDPQPEREARLNAAKRVFWQGFLANDSLRGLVENAMLRQSKLTSALPELSGEPLLIDRQQYEQVYGVQVNFMHTRTLESGAQVQLQVSTTVTLLKLQVVDVPRPQLVVTGDLQAASLTLEEKELASRTFIGLFDSFMEVAQEVGAMPVHGVFTTEISTIVSD